MTASDDLRSIEALLTDFAWNADRGDGQALGALFAPEATLTVGGQTHRGRAQIAADCERRASDPGRKVRHVWSNLKVLEQHEGEMRTAAVQLTFEQTAGLAKTQVRVNDLHDRFVKGPDGAWRFAERTIARAMALDF